MSTELGEGHYITGFEETLSVPGFERRQFAFSFELAYSVCRKIEPSGGIICC